MQDLFERKGVQTGMLNHEPLVSLYDSVITVQHNAIAWEDPLNSFGCLDKDIYTPVECVNYDGYGTERFTLVESVQYDNGNGGDLSVVEQRINDINDNDSVKSDVKSARKRHQLDCSTHRKPLLPPCQICGETATGFHYGANTCEACKGFFRRNMKKEIDINYKCRCTAEQKEAWTRGPRKNGCQACRYQRCLAVGMSRSAIKLGRYTYTHKTRNTKQAQFYKANNGSKKEVPTFSENSPSSSSSSSYSSSPGLYSGPCSPEDNTSSSMDRRIRPFDTCDSFAPKNREIKSTEHFENMGISLKDINLAVETLTEAHIVSFHPGNLPVEIIERKHTEYLQNYKSKKMNQTEPDINIQKRQVANLFNFFEDKIIKAVYFAKRIPGFRELTLDDQASLIKASRVEITLFGGYRYLLTNLDKERKVITTPWNEELHLDELDQFLPVNIVLQRYKYAQRLDELQLSTQELSVLQAIVTVASDRCLLEQPNRVDAVQQKLVTCLEQLLRTRPGGAGSTLYKIFNLITSLRELTEFEGELSKKMLSEWPTLSKGNFHLLKELST